MATEKQKKAMNLRNKEMAQGKTPPMGKILKKAGYSDAISKNPKMVTTSKGWNELLAKYNDEPIMDAVYKDCLDNDKRNATQNRNLYFKLKGRLQQTINVNEYKKELTSLIDEKNDTGEAEEESSKED